eukprot:1159421-Pelagomonas_calceolata.AAC.8
MRQATLRGLRGPVALLTRGGGAPPPNAPMNSAGSKAYGRPDLAKRWTTKNADHIGLRLLTIFRFPPCVCEMCMTYKQMVRVPPFMTSQCAAALFTPQVEHGVFDSDVFGAQTGTHPRVTTERNIERFRQQLQMLGFSYDWEREVATTDPGYIK